MSDDGGEFLGGLAAYAESLQGRPAMSTPRVMPTEPGWWWAKYKGGDIVAVEVFRYGGRPSEILIAFHPDRRLGWVRMDSISFEWIAPVPSREAVEAIALVIHKLIDGLDEHWKTTSDGQAVIREALQLVAGLTGNGGV